MAIYDNNGTTDYEIGKLYDNDGTTNYQTGKAYDNDGTADSLIYEFIFYLLSKTNGIRLGGINAAGNVAATYSDYSFWTRCFSGYYSDENNSRGVITYGVDLTNYSQMVVNVSEMSSYADAPYAGVVTSAGDTAINSFTKKMGLKTGENILDVSDLTGVYYFKGQCRTKANGQGGGFTIDEIYFC